MIYYIYIHESIYNIWESIRLTQASYTTPLSDSKAFKSHKTRKHLEQKGRTKRVPNKCKENHISPNPKSTHTKKRTPNNLGTPNAGLSSICAAGPWSLCLAVLVGLISVLYSQQNILGRPDTFYRIQDLSGCNHQLYLPINATSCSQVLCALAFGICSTQNPIGGSLDFISKHAFKKTAVI